MHSFVSDSGILYPSDIGETLRQLWLREMCLPRFWAILSSACLQICLYQVMTASVLLSDQKPSLQGILCFSVWNCSRCKFKVQSIQELHFYGSCCNICDSNSAKSLLQVLGNAPECWLSAFCKCCHSRKSFMRKITTYSLKLPEGFPSCSLHSGNLLFIATLAVLTSWVKNKTHTLLELWFIYARHTHGILGIVEDAHYMLID